MHPIRHASCILVGALLALSACGSDDPPAVVDAATDAPLGGDAGAADAGAEDAGSFDAGPSDAALPFDAAPTEDAGPPRPFVVDLWGGRVYGSILGISRIGRTLYLGTGLVIDPTDETSTPHAQLVRLDLDDGALRIFEDELPEVAYDEIVGPSATADAVADGSRVLVVGYKQLLALEGDAITSHVLSVGGAVASPTSVAVDREGGRHHLWVGTDRGLLRVNPTTFAVERTYASAELGASEVSPVAIDPTSGAVYAIAHPTPSSSRAVRIEGEDIAIMDSGAGGNPSGWISDVVFDTRSATALFTFATWEEETGGLVSWDGETVRTVLREGQLARVAQGEEGPFGASVLALDEAEGMLIVGGRLRSRGPIGIIEGGGLVFLDLTTIGGEPMAVGVSTANSGIRGDHVLAAAYDPLHKRTYVSLRQACSETRLGNMGLETILFEEGRPRFERTLLSGVRDLAVDGDRLLLAMRDDNPGLRCEGVNVQGGVVELRANRGGELPALRPTSGEGADLEAIHENGVFPSVLARLDDEHTVIGSRRDGSFVLAPSGTHFFNAALELGISLHVRSAAWVDADTFWIGGPATHHSGDPVELGDVPPHGAALVHLNDRGDIASYTRYVRATRDASPNVVAGAASSDVRDIVVASGGVTYLIHGEEQIDGDARERGEGVTYVHEGVARRGGVSRIDAEGALTVIADGAVVPDGRAGAIDASGTLWVLDRDRGLLRYDGSAFVAEERDPAIPATSVPTSLAFSEGGAMIATYSTGVYVRTTGASDFLEGYGFAWSALERAPGLFMVGTDQGLLRVRIQNAPDVEEPPVAAAERPPFGAIEPPPDRGDAGMCLGEHQVCAGNPEGCCPGLRCAGSGFVTACIP